MLLIGDEVSGGLHKISGYQRTLIL
jgi:hypothetical protein